MATVTGYTAQRMKAIEDQAIIDGNIVDDDLMLSRYDGTLINAGVVRGPQGIQGATGSSGDTSIQVVTSGTRPASPFEGLMIYETDTDNILTYNGTAWVLPNNVSPRVFGGYKELLDDRGVVSGTVTLDFATHNVWRIVPNGAVTIIFSNLPTAGFISSGTLIVGNSTYAITWPVGTRFPKGIAPVLSGGTYLSVLARSEGYVIVGTAWSAVA